MLVDASMSGSAPGRGVPENELQVTDALLGPVPRVSDPILLKGGVLILGWARWTG